jgi:hypothetical protein
MEHAAFITEQNAKLGPANAGGVLQHGLEHARQLAGRTADDTEDLGGRRLLIQRLGELLFQVGVVTVSYPAAVIAKSSGIPTVIATGSGDPVAAGLLQFLHLLRHLAQFARRTTGFVCQVLTERVAALR